MSEGQVFERAQRLWQAACTEVFPTGTSSVQFYTDDDIGRTVELKISVSALPGGETLINKNYMSVAIMEDEYIDDSDIVAEMISRLRLLPPPILGSRYRGAG